MKTNKQTLDFISSSMDDEQKKVFSKILDIGSEKFAEDFFSLIRSKTPLIYLTCNEEKRLLQYLDLFGKSRATDIFIWDVSRGLRDFASPDTALLLSGVGSGEGDIETLDEEQVLDFILQKAEKESHIKTSNSGSIFLLLDYHRYLDGHEDCSPVVERKLKNIFLSNSNISVILVGPKYVTTPSLDSYLTLLDFPYPSKKEIINEVDTIANHIKAKIPHINRGLDQKKEDIIKACSGLTMQDVSASLAQSLVRTREFDIPTIVQYKKQLIQKKGILEYVDSKLNFNDVGGLGPLIEWFKNRKIAMSDEAVSKHVDTVRGTLLTGTPGTGKSLIAKAVASEYNFPLLKLDFGSLFGSLVGESENNLREAIRLAEAMAPCVSEDTEIDVCDGRTFTIKEILESNENDLSTMSFDAENMKIVKDKIVAVIKQPVKKEMIQIDSWFGSVKTTLDHKLFVNKDGEIRQISAKDISPGDLLLVAKKLKRDINPLSLWDIFDGDARFFGKDIWKNNLCNINKKLLASRKYKKSFYVKLKEVKVKECLPESIALGHGGFAMSNCKINFDLFSIYYLLGMIDSDGFISKKSNRIGFVNTNKNLHKTFKNLIKKVFYINPICTENKCEAKDSKLIGLSECPNFKKCYTTYLCNKVIKSILVKAKNSLFSQDEDIISAYLSGYFDGDGCITVDKRNQPRMIFCSKRHSSWKVIRKCLHCIGILTPGLQSGHNVTVSSNEDVVLLSKKLKISHKDKIKKLKIIHRKNSSQRHRGYKIGKLLKSERILYGKRMVDLNVPSSYVSDVENKDKIVSLDKIAKISKSFSSKSKINNFCNSDFLGVEVFSKKAIGIHDCYDLMIKNNHNFFANGILSKNCILWCDEIEKGTAGTGSSNETDGGTTARVMQTLLTWMQEKTSQVFIIGTANNHEKIAPEFMRRFDEIWFVDNPSFIGRKQIFEIQFKSREIDYLKIDLDELVSMTNGYNGDEIRKIVNESLLDSIKDKIKMNTDLVKKHINLIKPLSSKKTNELAKIKEWAISNCRIANTLDPKENVLNKKYSDIVT